MSAHIFMLCDSDRDPLIQIASTYLSKSGPRIKGDLTILPTKKVARFPEGETRRLEEGKLLLKASEGRYRIALDAKGRSFDTQQWSQRIEQLLAERREVYGQFPQVNTSDRTPEAVAREVTDMLQST